MVSWLGQRLLKIIKVANIKINKKSLYSFSNVFNIYFINKNNFKINNKS